MEKETGLQRVTINDGETGKRIVDYPPAAVVEIADRARQQQIGWLIKPNYAKTWIFHPGFFVDSRNNTKVLASIFRLIIYRNDQI